jgi:hypothetical protein
MDSEQGDGMLRNGLAIVLLASYEYYMCTISLALLLQHGRGSLHHGVQNLSTTWLIFLCVCVRRWAWLGG